jgi:membrane associated rhomboid family serine protease
MFPLRDDNPALTTSFATLAIIGLNAAVWVFVQGLGTEPALSRSVCALGAIPGALLGRLPEGAQIPLGDVVCVLGEPSWTTSITSMFMHGGWMHILGNLWFLYVFGDNVEDSMGPIRFVVFYLLCGLAAVVAQVVSNPTSPIPMVGASGAIGGVMGAYAVLYPRVPVHMLVFLGIYVDRIVVPAYVMLGYWFLIQLVSGTLVSSAGGGVAFWAHVGGFVAGVVLVFRFRDARRMSAHREHLALARLRRFE